MWGEKDKAVTVMFIHIIKGPFEVFAPKATEIYHHLHVQFIHFVYQLFEVLNRHGELMIMYINKWEFSLCRMMFCYL